MALYDLMGNFIGDAYDEEERRRKEAEATPVKQTITTDPVTGKQTMKIEGSVQDLSAANPMTPTVISPVAPDTTFGRMVQAESGGQNYTPTGAPLTSPKGAMFANQVMPATAANPGFGVRPAQAQTPEEYNRVGQEYYQALLQKYNGDEKLAAAAYNMGPGAVDRNIQQNQGQFNVAAAPKETQGYLQKVLSPVLNAVVPSAQAAEVPQRPTAPVPPNGQYVNLSNSQSAPVAYQAPSAPTAPAVPAPEQEQVAPEQLGSGGLERTAPGVAPGIIPGVQATPTVTNVAQQFIDAQKSPDQLAIIAADKTQDPTVRQLARDTYYKQESQYRQLEDAKVKLKTAFENNDFNSIARDMRKGGGLGDWFKYIFFKSNGFNEAADNVAEKLGLNDQYQQTVMPDGTKVIASFGTSGIAKSGINLSTGKALSDSELDAITGRPGLLGKGASLSSEVYIDKSTGQRYRSGYDSSGRAAMVNVQGGSAYTGDPRNLEVQSIGTSIAKAEGAKAVDLRYAGPIAYTKAGAEFIGKYNAENGTNLGYATETPGAPLIDRNTGQAVTLSPNGTIRATTTTTVPTATTPPTTTAPAAITSATPGVPGSAAKRAPLPGETPAQYTAYSKAYDAMAKDLSEGVAKVQLGLPQYESTADQLLKTIDRVVGTYDKDGKFVSAPGFETNVGVKGITGYLQLPGTEARGWTAQYKHLISETYMKAFEQLRGAGAISDAEGKAATAAQSALTDPGISEEDFKKNAKILEDSIKRGVNRQRALAGLPPKYENISNEAPTQQSEVMNKADEILNKDKKKK